MTHSGIIIGYDPGGNRSHGVAALTVEDGVPVELTVCTVANAEAAINWFTTGGHPFAAGIDTLTALSTGPSGWRPADRWLREQYPQVVNSVISPNSLYGAMALNGMAAMVALRSEGRDVAISETHPKVLYYALTGIPYDFSGNSANMIASLSQWLGIPVNVSNEHEWDAALSCHAVLEGVRGNWICDLHALPTAPNKRLLAPAGESQYYWPPVKPDHRTSACT